MARTEVVFKGIHRDTNEAVCADGECMKLTNMTATREGLKVLTAPHEADRADGAYHDIRWFAKGGCWLALDGDNHLYYAIPPTPPAESNVANVESNVASTASNVANLVFNAILTAVTITGYETVGNMICCFTSQGIYYVLYKGEEYVNLGYAPNTPRLRVSNMEMKVEDTIELDKPSGDGTSREYVSGMCVAAQALLEKKGYFIDRTFYRVGFKLFDGTYVSVSPIYCCEPTETQNESVKQANDTHILHKITYYPGLDEKYDAYDGASGTSMPSPESNPLLVSGLQKDAFNYAMGKKFYATSQDVSYYDIWCGVCGFKPTLKLDYVDLSEWKSIITSIDVFTTGSVRHHEMIKEDDGKERMSYIKKDEYAKKVEQALLTFRKCASFNVNGEMGWQLDDVSQDNLQVQDALSDFNYNNTIVSSDDAQTYVYNSRLHVGNLSEALPSSYKLPYFLNFLHIPRQQDDYQYIKFASDWIAFRLHAYDFADFMDVVTDPNNPTPSNTYLYRYKAWMSFKITPESSDTYDKRIVYTGHRVDRNGHEEVNRNNSPGGYGTDMVGAFVYFSVHERSIIEVTEFTTITSSNRSTHATEDGIRTDNMFSTVETIGEIETDAGVSKVYGSYENTPLVYTTPIVSYPHNLAYKLTAYKKYTGNGYTLIVDGTTYFLVSEFPEIFFDSYYYRWKSASGNELFTTSLTSTTIYTISGIDDKCRVFGVLLYKDTDVTKTTPASSSIGHATDFTCYLKKEFGLRNIGIGNISVCLDWSRDGHNSFCDGGTYVGGTIDVEALEENSVIHRSDVLKVSGLDNPLVFPSAQTYQLGSAIRGMGANVNALSQGQHGEDPLYVFTERGIRAMVVDRTGQTVYPAIDDVCGDVLEGGMVATEDGVVFATADGLMLIQGKRTLRLSRALDGEDAWVIDGVQQAIGRMTPSKEITAAGTDTDALARVLNAAEDVTETAGQDGTIPGRWDIRFAKYIQGAVLGYSYRQRLLYVANPAKPYMYVYNMDSGEWSQLSAQVNAFASRWPECIGVKNEVSGESLAVSATVLMDFDPVYDAASAELRSEVTTNAVLLVTRPMKLGSVSLKKINQWAMNAYLRLTGENVSDGDSDSEDESESDSEDESESDSEELTTIEGAGYDRTTAGGEVFILGSYDGLSYQVCARKSLWHPMNGYISPLMRTNAYRYFVFVLQSGVMLTNSIVNGLMFDADEAFSSSRWR